MKDIKEMIAGIENGRDASEVFDEFQKSIHWYHHVLWWFFDIPVINNLMIRLEKWTKEYEAKHA